MVLEHESSLRGRHPLSSTIGFCDQAREVASQGDLS
jgi:hypothetical protein